MNMGSIFKPKYKDRKTGEARESSIYWVAYYRAGRQLRESAGTAIYTKAKSFLAIREGMVARGAAVNPQIGRIKFSEMAEEVINDYKANQYRSLIDLEGKLKNHLLPAFGEARASVITTSDLRKYITTRQQEGASNATVNREMACVKRMYRLAVQAGKVMNIPYIPMVKEAAPRSGFFEREQFESVRSHLHVDLQPVATFAFITGWRKSEVLNLRWPQVDFKAAIVRLEPGTTKNREARAFPFTEELRSLLEEQRAKADALKQKGIICPFVFNRNGKRIGYFRRSWRTACIAAGCPGRLIHDFRRTAVRNLVRAGIAERVAMTLSGHKTRSVFDRYNIVAESDLLDAAKRLDSMAQQSKFHAKSAPK
jgi:integrase